MSFEEEGKPEGAKRISRRATPISKEEALARCDSLHKRLLQCYEKGGDWCRDESKDFWDCYRKAKGEDKIKFDFTRIFGGGS